MPVPLATLVLLRLLPPSRKPVPVPRVVADLAALLGRAVAKEEVVDCLEALRASGEVEGAALTEVGRARSLRFLGLPSWPKGWTWRQIKERALPARALALAPTDPGAARLLRDGERLGGVLLRRALDLPGEGRTAREALEALVCRELGHPEATSLEALYASVLSARIGADRPLEPRRATVQATRVLLSVGGGVASLRERLVAGYLASDPNEESLERFAERVRAAARASASGRFGRNKVLVHHVWRELGAEAELAAFKARLLEANARHLVELSRADLPQLLDPEEVRQAEIVDHGSRYHFVLDVGAP